MHTQTETRLRRFAHDFLQTALKKTKGDLADASEEAWPIFQDEARLQYRAEDDGDGDKFWNDIATIFEEEKHEFEKAGAA
jgi:hypothetical protein